MISRLFFLVSWFPDLVFFSCAPPFIREAPASLLLSRLMPVRLGPVHLARPTHSIPHSFSSAVCKSANICLNL
jgi:hypothetical protein